MAAAALTLTWALILAAGEAAAQSTTSNIQPEQFDFIIPNAFAYRSADVRLEKGFRFGGAHRLSVAIEGVNIFSFDNFANIDGDIPTLPSVNPNFGRGRRLIDPGRRLQFGVRYAF